MLVTVIFNSSDWLCGADAVYSLMSFNFEASTKMIFLQKALQLRKARVASVDLLLR